MRAMKSAFRYPGSKERIAGDIIRFFPSRVLFAQFSGELSCYCEPFIGCGAMATRIIPCLPHSTRIIFGDLDYGIVSLWRCIVDAANHRRLCNRIINYKPSVADFYRFKELDGETTGDPVELGFRKFVLHQMSFSGLGAKAGGPIGGRGQRSDYDVTCRFRPARHVHDIRNQHLHLSAFDVKVLHADFAETMSHVSADGFVYLDPPYYLQGGALYANNMSPADHARLADVLRDAPYEWVLSYDSHQEVRRLYGEWANIDSFKMTATIDTKRGAASRRKSDELVITPRD